MFTQHGPEETVHPPPDSDFTNANNVFVPNPDLEDLVGAMIEQDAKHFNDLRELRFVGLWQLEGGKKGGVANLGQAAVATPREQLGVAVDVFVWTAKDWIISYKFNWWQYEALAYHLLCGVQVTENGPKVIQPPIRAHVAELERYGAWNIGLQAAQKAMGLQMPLGLNVRANAVMGAMDDLLEQANARARLRDLGQQADELLEPDADGNTVTVERVDE